MHCEETRELFSPWLDGELDQQEAVLFQEHLDSCSECRGELALWEKVSTTLKGMKEEIPAPPGLTSIVMARVQQLEQPVRKKWWSTASWKHWVAGVAAAAFLALGSLDLILPPGPEPVQVAENEMDPQPAVSPQKEPGQPVGEGPVVSPPATTNPDTPVTNSPDQPSVNSPGPTNMIPPTKPDPGAKPGVTMATAEPRVFLSKDRIITNTLLKLEVDEPGLAQNQATSKATQLGIRVQQVAQPQAVGNKSYVMLKFTVPAAKADSFLSDLSSLGTVLDKQTQTQDISQKFSETLDQYRGLLTQYEAAEDEAKKQQLEKQVKNLENQLATWETEADHHTLVLWLQS